MDLEALVQSDATFCERYELGARFAFGGMGAIYLGIQRSLQRQVAIKFMIPELLTDDQQRQRFLDEARVAANLAHSHVVGVIDFGFAAEIPYIVSQYVEGNSLEKLLKTTPRRPAVEVLTWSQQILDGLQAIHDLGVIHRDLKPANILITSCPRSLAKILDFGIAKQIKQTKGVSGLTDRGILIGTPQYMSPEQAVQDPLGPASDIYSFAVILYQMVVGRLPFTSESVVELLHKHIHEPPELPANLRPSVKAVLQCGLEKDPSQRFATADEFKRTVQELAGEIGTGEFWVDGESKPSESETPLAERSKTLLLAPLIQRLGRKPPSRGAGPVARETGEPLSGSAEGPLSGSTLSAFPDSRAQDSRPTHEKPAPGWSGIIRGTSLTLRLLPSAESYHADLNALEPGATLRVILDGPRENETEGGSSGSVAGFVEFTLTNDREKKELVRDGVSLKLPSATLIRLASSLEKRERFDLEFPDRGVLRVRWTGAFSMEAPKTKRFEVCPQREEVPIPSPLFDATGQWINFTTPFGKYSMQGRKVDK